MGSTWENQQAKNFLWELLEKIISHQGINLRSLLSHKPHKPSFLLWQICDETMGKSL